MTTREPLRTISMVVARRRLLSRWVLSVILRVISMKVLRRGLASGETISWENQSQPDDPGAWSRRPEEDPGCQASRSWRAALRAAKLGFALRRLRGLDRGPQTKGRRRHVDLPDAEVGERIENGAHDDRQRARTAGFAASLGADRIGLRRNRVVQNLECRSVGGARHGVIHERAGAQLALGVVKRVFHQRLAETLHRTTMDLALDEHRVHHRAEIIAADVAIHMGLARLRIDLDLGDVTAVGEDAGDGGAHFRVVEGARHAGREVCRLAQSRREIDDADRAVGAGNGEAPFREFDVLDARLEQRGRRKLAALYHHVERGDDRRAARHDRARAARAASAWKEIAVALVEADALERHAELVDDNLREGRLMALA